MAAKDLHSKAQEYSAHAQAAESQAAKTDDLQLKASFEGIARVYREMAERARKLLDEDQTQEPPPK